MALAFLFYLLCAITDCPPPLIHHSSRNPAPNMALFQASANGIFPMFSRTAPGSRFTRSHQDPLASDKDNGFAPRVFTRVGDIEGRFIESREGRKIAAFEGIPYAKPPTGRLRFKNPIPVKPWKGKGRLMVANRTGMDCLQLDFSRMLAVRGSEDCLYINIYANHASLMIPSSRNSRPPAKSLLPVIVFIHGGGWMSSSGTNYGPKYLLDRDVILVTFNYRLGVLGFLSTGDEASRGNFALQDQALALNWIYEHISAFGGNPNKITLMGESSGAASVALHMLSPVTSRLLPSIHGAILLSGGSMNHWAIMNDTISNTKAIARRMQCPTESSQKLVSCLRQRDPYMVVGQQMHLWKIPVISRLLFGPVIESAIDNPTAFITESPLVSYTQRPQSIKPIPVISGINQNEGAMFSANVYIVPFLYSAINSEWDKMAAYAMAYDKLPGVNVRETSRKISKFYFNNKRWSFNNRDQISDALGDRTIATGVYKFLQHHSKHAPSYGYFFTYRSNTSSSLLSQMGLRSDEWGVSHGDELPFIFSMDRYFDDEFRNPKDLALSRWLVDVCTNFAHDRQPLPANQVSENVTWSPILNPKYMELLEINVKKRMIPFPYMDRMKFWDSLKLN